MPFKLFFTLSFALLGSWGSLFFLPISGIAASPLSPARPVVISSGLITPTVVTGSGTLSVTQAISTFRSLIGSPDNGDAAGQQPAGRREIDWEGVPPDLTNIDTYPTDFFNTGVPRGLVLDLPNDMFRVSDNNFSDVNATYGTQFKTFSAAKSAAPVGTNILTLTFRVAGEDRPATVAGFGAIFSDVDVAGAASLEFFFGRDSLGVFTAPVRSDADGLSFVGVQLDGQPANLVRITSGQGSLGAGVSDLSDGGSLDLVVLDNFVYSEPQALAVVYLPLVLK